ncbi:Uncharacterised protein [Mycobacteroides abscessus subsp. abscessus]|nr:Uncharacterised protein [Mycobacteroides abscessus subsp. abscessus]SLE51816.1 Uncharacterised protein [Mycobacteroides abscessus subsp. abscessus]
MNNLIPFELSILGAFLIWLLVAVLVCRCGEYTKGSAVALILILLMFPILGYALWIVVF